MPTFAEIKKQEAQSRMLNIRKAQRSRRAALEIQRRTSMVGGKSSRILNLREVAKVMAKWA